MAWFPRYRRRKTQITSPFARQTPKHALPQTPKIVEVLEKRALLAFSGNVVGTVATWSGDGTGNTLVIDQVIGFLRHNAQAGFNSDFDFDSFLPGDQLVPAALGSEFRVGIVSGANDSLTFGTAVAGLDQLGGAKMTVTATGADLGDTVTANFSNNAVTATYNGNTLTGTGNANLDISTANPRGGVAINFGSANDTFTLTSTAVSTIPVTVQGGGGSDTVGIGNAGSVQSILAPVTVRNTAGFTALTIDDSTDATARTTTITGTQVTGIAPAAIDYVGNDLSSLSLKTGTGVGNVVNVLSTSTTTFIIGVRSSSVNIGNAGSLAGITSPVTVSNPPSFTNLTIDDSADATGRNVVITNNSVNVSGSAAINYAPNDITGLNFLGGLGADAINVNSTSAIPTYVIKGGAGDDSFNVAGGPAILGSITLDGETGDDTFNLNMAAGANLAAVNFAIIGGSNTAIGRDRVNVNANAPGDGARNVGLGYQAGAGAVNVTGFGPGLTIGVTTVEQLNYAGDAANNDTVNVSGINNADNVLSVTPLTNNSANVFLNGTPTILIPPGSAATNNPGIAGGGTSPDISVAGLSLGSGLQLSGGVALPGGGNQLVVNGSTENINGVGGTSAWGGNAFGSANTAIRAAGQAFDTVLVTDNQIAIDNNNPGIGQLLRVNYNTATFNRVNSLEPDVIVNAGEESAANLPGSGIADTFNVNGSTVTRFQLNGGDPPPPTAPNGDLLNLIGVTASVWSDKASPPNVSIRMDGFLPVGTNSIERIGIIANTVNFIGDNNDPNVDQNDNFVVVGTAPNTFTGTINGSTPIFFSGVSFLNAFGDDQNPPPGTPSVGPNDIDTLEITPYADNTPKGWGVATSFNEGNPVDTDGAQADLLIVNGINGVSEDVVVRPADVQNGQVVVTQGLTNVPIAIINFIANTDIVFQNYNGAGQPDTDTLTLDSTLAQQPGSSINADYRVDLTAAGTPAAPKISVDAGTPFYRVRDFSNFGTFTIQGNGGADTVEYVGTANDDSFTVAEKTGTFDSVSTFDFSPVRVVTNDVRILRLTTVGGNDTFNLAGDSNASHFFASDGVLNTFARVNDGAQVVFAGVTTVRFQGVGLDDLGFQTFAPAYTLDSAARSLTDGTVTYDLAAVQSVRLFGVGANDALTVIGGAGDDAYAVALTGPAEGSLDASFGAPTVLSLQAQFYAGYTLQGGAGGTDSVSVKGTTGDDAASYDGTAVTVGGLSVNVATGIDTLSVDLGQGNDSLTLVGSANADAFSVSPTSTAFDSNLTASVGATGPQAIAAKSVEALGITGNGGADVLTLNGTLANNTFAMTDTTARVDSGPVVTFGTVPTVALVGSGGTDNVVYTGASANYTLNAGATPKTLSNGTTTVQLNGIDRLDLAGTAAGDSLTVVGTATNDDFAVALTGGGEGSLAATVDGLKVGATTFGGYVLDGGAGGTDSVSVTGTNADNVASYDGTTVVVDGFSVNVATGIDALTVDLLDGADSLALTGSAGADAFGVSPTSTAFDSILTVSVGATGPQLVTAKSVEALSVTGNGGADVLTLNGTLADNTFAMSDTTARVDSGPVVTYIGIPSITLNGSGGTDNLVYSAANAAYALDASGANPTLTTGGVTTTLASVESLALNGGAAGDSLSVVGTANDDLYTVALTGPGEAKLTVGLNALAVTATRFSGYTLDGGAGGFDTVTVIGTDGDNAATYNGTAVTVDGFTVAVNPTIDGLTLNLLGGSDTLQLVGTAGNDTYNVSPAAPPPYSADLIVGFAGSPNVPMQVRSVEAVGITSNGGTDTLNVNGDGTDNAFTQTDTTLRVDQSPVFTYAGVTNVNLFGLGGNDTLYYTGALAAYTLNTGGANPTLSGGGVTTTLTGFRNAIVTGTAAVNTLTVVGTAANDTFNVLNTATGKGQLTSQLGLLATTANTFSNYVINGGAGFDKVVITGTDGADTVTSTGSVVTLNGLTVDIGTNDERVELYTLAGADSITLGLTVPGLVAWVDSGADNDTVDLTATTIPTSIFGGTGDDTLTGGSSTDYIDGGAGNDSIRGLGGVDTVYGGDGNDTILGGAGNDQMFGGDGSDTFIWNPGDASDLIEGQGGQNVLIFNGADGVDDTFVMSPSADGSRLRFDRQPGNVVIDAAGIQQVFANAGSGSDSVTINDLSDTEVKTISVTLGALATPDTPDGVRDNITINGRQAPNAMYLTVQNVPGVAGATQVDVQGLAQHIFLRGTVAACPSVPTDDFLTLNTGIGNDTIVAASAADSFVPGGVGPVELKVAMLINAGSGADFVQANATINGGAGDDTLKGAGGDCSLTIDGGADNDQICGNPAGNDTLIGGTGNDSIYGLGGNDSITGGSGNDFLAGGDGNDLVDGGDGNDTMLGGAGNDSLTGGNGNDLMLGDADAECGSTAIFAISAGWGNDTLLGNAGNDTLNGDNGDDSLVGGDGNDQLGPVDIYGSVALPIGGIPGSPTFPAANLLIHFGDDGNDTMDGGNGNDTIQGDSGNDSLIGAAGDDLINGNDGDDTITGGTGNDTIDGGAGADLIAGDDGNDSILGGAGDDTITGNAGDDVIYGNDGNDSISGGDGNDTVSGGAGNDSITGDLGNDVLAGDAGDDTISGGIGNDTISGGDGADLIAGGEDNDVISGGAGNDTITGDGGNDFIAGDAGNDSISGGEGNDTIDGGAGNDTITGDAGNDLIAGAAGDDLISGNDGNDSISGGAGNDTIDAGTGDDLVQGDAGNDSIVAGLGNDTVLGGDGNDTIFGNDGADLILGNAGDDSIDAGAGNDTVYGGTGNDSICGGDGNDLLSGDAGDDVVLGQAGNDVIYGGDGNDQLWGGVGNDTVFAGAGNDSVVGGDGNDLLYGGDGDDWMYGQAGNDTIFGEFGNDAIYGNDGNDVLYGGTLATSNQLHTVRPPAFPSDGDDLVSGGTGNDRVDGGNGNNLLDAGDDGIRETVYGGRGNDYAFVHHNHDSYKDFGALDGGRNRVFKDPNGAIVDPPVPAEMCARVVFAAPTLPVLHGIVIQPGAVLQPSGTPPAPFPVFGVTSTKKVVTKTATPKTAVPKAPKVVLGSAANLKKKV